MRIFQLLREKQGVASNTRQTMDTKLTTDEAKSRLYRELTEFTGWKFLKSEPCLRKRVDDMVLDLVFYGSKYNSLEDVVDVNCEFRIWSKSLDKVCNVNSSIAYYSIQPDGEYWYNIASQRSLQQALTDMKKKIEQYALPAAEAFENSREDGLRYLGKGEMREIYHVDSFGAYAKITEGDN